MDELSCDKCIDRDEKIKHYERRLAITTQEKKLAVEMFQAGAQRIEQLEQELNCNDDKKKFEEFKKQVKEMTIQLQSDYSDAIEILEHKLASVSSDLELETHKTSLKEAELRELQNKIEVLKNDQEQYLDLQNREKVLREKCLSLEAKCSEYENIIQNVRPLQVLEEEVERLRKQLSTVERQRNDLQDALEETQKSAERLISEELEARHKVCEAISIVETTLVEKQQIQNQLLLSESECKRLQKELIDLIEEAGKRVKKEVESVKKSFQEQMQSAQSEMNLLEMEKNKKISQLEKQQQEIIRLENELEELKRKSVSPRKLKAMSDDLIATQVQLQQLQTENKSLNEIIMQNQHRYESELSRCGIERRFLEKQILKLQTNLGETGHNLERAVEHCHQLADHLNKLSSEITSERVVNETESTELIKQLQMTKVQSNSAMEELKKFVNTHNNITSKWKDEYSSMTSKFSERMKELKLENKKEKKRNKKLLKKLANVQTRKEVNILYSDEPTVDDNDIIAAVELNNSHLPKFYMSSNTEDVC